VKIDSDVFLIHDVGKEEFFDPAQIIFGQFPVPADFGKSDGPGEVHLAVVAQAAGGYFVFIQDEEGQAGFADLGPVILEKAKCRP
jgi:hypothetical protein